MRERARNECFGNSCKLPTIFSAARDWRKKIERHADFPL
jgi:hypothetical protein